MAFLLKITITDFEHASRDKREISVVKELGHDVEVIAKSKDGINTVGTLDDYKVHYLSSRPLGNSRYLLKLNRILSVFYWANYVRKLNPTCISGHNLEAIYIGWISNWFKNKRNKVTLVYDPHEYTLKTKEKSNPNKLYKSIIAYIEKFIIKTSAFTITVNDSIADAMMSDYNLPERPLVVRNVANYWNIDPSVCLSNREKICNNLEIPVSSFLVMYHGAVMSGRGIENLLKAAKQSGNDVAVVILGYGTTEYIELLKQLAKDLGVKVYFHDAVNVNSLWKYIGAVDAGVSLATNTCINHFYMLPNKIFENIQSLTPIIASDFPEIRKIIEKYNIGLCCDASNILSISSAINKLKTEKDLYSNLKENLVIAKKELSWENEKKVLQNAYEKVLGDLSDGYKIT